MLAERCGPAAVTAASGRTGTPRLISLRARGLRLDRQAGRPGPELPQSALCKVADAGHMIHHIVPEQVAVILNDARAALAVRGM